MKVRAIIQARMLSQRFRGKSLIAVHNVPLLYRVVNAVKQLSFINEVLVATTNLEADDPIEAAAKQLNVLVFRGSALDVLNRYAEASSDLNEGDLVVRFTADNPFNNKSISVKAFEKHISNHVDYTHVEGLSHIVPEFISVRALREAEKSATLFFDREHVTPFFRKNDKLFKVQTLPADFDGLRHDLDKFLTVDTNDDLVRFEKMIEALKLDDQPEYSYPKIYEWLEKNELRIRQAESSSSLVVNLAGTPVGYNYPAYIIAEIGQNHNGDVNLAKKLIDMSVRCGASAVKFQKRDIPSELTKEAYDKPYDNPNSFGRTYGEHRIFLELNEEQHKELKEYANSLGMTYFCTPCDVPSLEMMERIGCPFYKVASRDLTNIPLLQAMGRTGKPVIISTGMADFDDIDDALDALNAKQNKVIIMQCTSEYPCKLENVNLRAMDTLKEKYGYVVGLSDHTSGVVISTAAVVHGAALVEKHVSLDRTMKGTDQAGSLEEAGLKKLIEYIRATELAMGDGIKDVNPATKAAKEKLARSLTSKVKIAKGTILTEEMLTLKSPGTGLKWRERAQVVGKKALVDIDPDCTLNVVDFS